MKKASKRTAYLIVLLAALSLNVSKSAFSQPVSSGCNNVDFEYGNFTNWVGYTGSCCPVVMTNTGLNTIGPPGDDQPQHYITPGSLVGLTDPNSANQITYVDNLPGGGIYSCRLGNSSSMYHAERLEYSLNVTNSNCNFFYDYAVILDDPGHIPAQQPSFQISILNSTGTTQLGGSCGLYLVVAGANIPGFYTYSPSLGINYRYKTWTLVGCDLSAYIGQTVIIRFTTSDCGYGGHFGYAYIDAGCTSLNLILNYCTGNNIATVTAPPGFTYSWTGPGIVNPITTQTLSLNNFSVGSTYSCVCTSVQGCTFTLTTVIAPTIVTANFTDTITCLYASFYDLSTAANQSSTFPITNWLWDFGDGATSLLQNPTHLYTNPGSYTVSLIATTAMGCVDTATYVVTVGHTSPNFIAVVTATPATTVSSTASICDGDSAVINVTTGNVHTYQWLSTPFDPTLTSQTSINPITVYPNVTTSYMVTISDTFGCISKDTAIVNVTPLPTPVISGSHSVCTGSSHLYSVPLLSGHTYNWTITGGTPTSSTSDTVTVTWGPAGPGTLIVTEVNGICSTTTPVYNVAINPLPNATAASNSPICNGATLILNGNGGATYVWSGPNNFVSSLQSPYISGATVLFAGTYNLTVTSSNGCISYANTLVGVNAPLAPVASSNSPICAGDSLLLSTTSGGGITYSWSGPAGYTSTDQNPSIAQTTSILTGIYIVTVTDALGCTASSSVNATINTIFPGIGNNSPVCSSGNLNVFASGGVTYNWSGPAGFTSTQSNVVIGQPATSYTGTYYVTITDANGCVAQLSTYSVVNPLPTPVVTSNSPICEGEDLKLSCNGASTYFWSGPSNFVSTIQNPDISSASVVAGGTYNVVVSDMNGCISATSTNVTVNPMPIVVVWNNTPVCIGQSVSITSSGGTGYAWSCAENSFTSNSQNITFSSSTLANNGHYTVTVTLNGCTSTATTLVTVNTFPQPTAVSNSPVCYGDPLKLVATGGINFAWSCSNGFTSISPQPIISSATDAASGTYYVTVTDINGCSSVASTVATVTTKITLNTIDQTICSGTTTTIGSFALGGTPPYTYYWNGSPSQSHVTVTPLSSISFQVQVTDTNGCKSNVSTLHITVIPPVKITSISSKDTVCPGESVSIQINPIQGNGGPYTFYLTDGTIITSPYITYPDGIHELIIFAQDNCGNTDSDTIRIHVYEVPPMSYAPDKTFGCIPLEVYFNETSADIGQQYEWNFGDNSYNSSSFIQNPNHIYTASGTFDVNLNITSTNGCTTVYRYPGLITAYPLPGSEFTSDKGGANITDGTIIFKNLSKDANCKSYWTFGDGDSSDARNPVHRYDSVGVFPVKLISISLEGCTDTAVKNILILNDYTFYAPTAFTPDNDGTNDFFYILGNGIDPNSFLMMVYDRWGEKIFETHSYDLNNPAKYGWDGKVKGKKMAEPGVYSWIVIYKDTEKVEHQQTGLITLIK